MITAYLYYPNNIATIHTNNSCSQIQKSGKQGQRILNINAGNISTELSMFMNNQYYFTSDKSDNDMVIRIDFDNQQFEKAVLDFIVSLLGKNYKTFANAAIKTHC